VRLGQEVLEAGRELHHGEVRLREGDGVWLPGDHLPLQATTVSPYNIGVRGMVRGLNNRVSWSVGARWLVCGGQAITRRWCGLT
jgi:hypothetical protein